MLRRSDRDSQAEDGLKQIKFEDHHSGKIHWGEMPGSSAIHSVACIRWQSFKNAPERRAGPREAREVLVAEVGSASDRVSNAPLLSGDTPQISSSAPMSVPGEFDRVAACSDDSLSDAGWPWSKCWPDDYHHIAPRRTRIRFPFDIPFAVRNQP